MNTSGSPLPPEIWEAQEELKVERYSIGEVFVSSLFIMFRVCMSVCLSYETACRAGSYVCTFGAILRIRLAEEYQSVWNKQVDK